MCGHDKWFSLFAAVLSCAFILQESGTALLLTSVLFLWSFLTAVAQKVPFGIHTMHASHAYLCFLCVSYVDSMSCHCVVSVLLIM